MQHNCEPISGKPDADQAHVFVIPLAASAVEYALCESTLSPDEFARAQRFVHADVRRRFVICRGNLRRILARLLAREPAAVRFQYERWGKPRLGAEHRTQLHFNVSHSGEWALIAVALAPLGVDLEVFNARISYRAIASQILSPQELGIWQRLSGPAQELATMQAWVCKEALLKAMGLGIAEGLKQISLPIPVIAQGEFAPMAIDGQLQMHLEDDGTCRTNHWIDAQAWRLRMLELVPHSYSAICTSKHIERILISPASASDASP